MVSAVFEVFEEMAFFCGGDGDDGSDEAGNGAGGDSTQTNRPDGNRWVRVTGPGGPQKASGGDDRGGQRPDSGFY